MGFDYNRATLDEIRQQVTMDGIISDDEVDGIRRRLFLDGRIDREEAELVFELNDATSGCEENSAKWQVLFIDAIASFVLGDANSPEQIDDDEAKWLVERIEGDGQYDANERALLAHLKQHASRIAAPLANLLGKLHV